MLPPATPPLGETRSRATSSSPVGGGPLNQMLPPHPPTLPTTPPLGETRSRATSSSPVGGPHIHRYGGSPAPQPLDLDDPYRMMRLRPIDGADADVSASASDAGSTISTNPNSIFSNSNTVRYGNVLSLEDFKGCPCPLDDIVEHEHLRAAEYGTSQQLSPRSVRVNQSSRADSPGNQDDFDLGDEVISNPPDERGFSSMGLDDLDDDAMLQLAMYASLNEHAGPSSGGPSSAIGDDGYSGGNGSFGRRFDHHDASDSYGGHSIEPHMRAEPEALALGRSSTLAVAARPSVALSARARGKMPLYVGTSDGGVPPGGGAHNAHHGYPRRHPLDE